MPIQYSYQMEFHIARRARDKYQFDQSIYSFTGNVIFANFHGARKFAQKINARRDLISFPEQAVRAGQINAMGLIDEILHYVVTQYSQEREPAIIKDALEWLYRELGIREVNAAFNLFASEFPPLAVYTQETSLEDYLEGESLHPNGRIIPNRQIVLEELMLLWLANKNLAFSPYHELFDDTLLKKTSAYPEIMASLHDFFDTKPPFGPDNQNLLDMLRAPAIAVPHSLTGQLEYIRTRWKLLLGKYLYRLLSSLDLIKEEEKAIFIGPGPARVIDFSGQELEVERFSPDKEWMPKLVLLAKNSYVWLDQLSKKYKRSITSLDEIPDEELDSLSRWGFTGLWLIGLWERSEASKRIKQLRGNPDAVASAYSLYNYDIAKDLGGNEAYQNLRDRTWKRGIRLSSDMVPNHMGIDSQWLVEHPDWFVALDYSPFPSYSFNGPNLSWNERVGIFIEDHYYNNTDAAVVFKRVDFWTGSEKYVYHGNDGTSMPWNDTAQLNYLLPEVREAVIQTILHVARKFPVIRFDAAMTLAKKHYQRLWFPEPGSGGDIPSRADHGLTREQFDAAIPVEFWREVVDRVAQEVPDTLLLAEAFWLMEGYFVRTLGMHRVYNSAFMNMLRDEKNQEYRLVIKNTLEFDPEILKRYVNFMNNPDERTAVDQFGKGDKYFGICAMMVTMPGLPMFGHGQIEGYTEKYGMEYRRAYWDERPDAHLVDRHEREIFPLLRKRYLFAGVDQFLLYDFYATDGHVNEDVFAFSNETGGERGLVLYHNKFNSTRGWIKTSAGYSVKTGQGDERVVVQKSLGEGLGLANDPNVFVIFRDHINGLEYIRNNQEIYDQGLYAELSAYQYQVFLDFREIPDNEWHQYAHLAGYLNGRGVPNIDEALKEIFLQPIHNAFRELVNMGSFRWLIERRYQPDTEDAYREQALDEVESKTRNLFKQTQELTELQANVDALAVEVRQAVAGLLKVAQLKELFPWTRSRKYKQSLAFLDRDNLLSDGDLARWGTLLAFLFTRTLGKLQFENPDEAAEQSRTWIDEWLLGKMIALTLQDLGLDEQSAWQNIGIVRLLTGHQTWWDSQATKKDQAVQVLQTWLRDGEIQRYLGINRHQGVLWFQKESFESLLWWFYSTAVIDMIATAEEDQGDPSSAAKEIVACHDLIAKLLKAEQLSDYQLEKLLEAAKG